MKYSESEIKQDEIINQMLEIFDITKLNKGALISV